MNAIGLNRRTVFLCFALAVVAVIVIAIVYRPVAAHGLLARDECTRLLADTEAASGADWKYEETSSLFRLCYRVGSNDTPESIADTYLYGGQDVSKLMTLDRRPIDDVAVGSVVVMRASDIYKPLPLRYGTREYVVAIDEIHDEPVIVVDSSDANGVRVSYVLKGHAIYDGPFYVYYDIDEFVVSEDGTRVIYPTEKANDFERAAQEQSTHGFFPRRTLGVTGVALSSENQAKYGAPIGHGYLLTESESAASPGIFLGFAADAAGLLVGDVILSVDGEIIQTLKNTSSFSRQLQDKTFGEAVRLTILRDGDELDVDVVLGVEWQGIDIQMNPELVIK